MIILALAMVGYLRKVDWELQGQVEGAAPSNFGGNDWVKWEDTDKGVVAKKIHPLIQSNPILLDQHFHEGDILRRIEYQDVYRAEMVNELSKHTAPGTVVLYWVERPGAAPSTRR